MFDRWIVDEVIGCPALQGVRRYSPGFRFDEIQLLYITRPEVDYCKYLFYKGIGEILVINNI